MVQANVVVDLSHHNAHVDFSAAASEIRAVFHKATQGLEMSIRNTPGDVRRPKTQICYSARITSEPGPPEPGRPAIS